MIYLGVSGNHVQQLFANFVCLSECLVNIGYSGFSLGNKVEGVNQKKVVGRITKTIN